MRQIDINFIERQREMYRKKEIKRYIDKIILKNWERQWGRERFKRNKKQKRKIYLEKERESS